MIPHYGDETITLHHGDCLDVLRELADNSVDSVVTDPPYGLEFMGKEWDAPWKASSVGRGVRVEAERASEITERGKGHSTPGGPYLAARVDSVRVAGLPFQQWCTEWTAECFRVLKPGGHLLAFGGTRTWHRLACAVEDAGFEVRDSIAWLYGSGFPKSLDVSKAIDKAAGAERPILDTIPDRWAGKGSVLQRSTQAEAESVNITAPATPDAETWQGWGTALKPGFEPVVVARKPLVGTVAANVLTHGTGALNIDGCRVEHASEADLATSLAKNPGRSDSVTSGVYGADRPQQRVNTAGRWPANVVLDETQADALDEQSGETVSTGKPRPRGDSRAVTQGATRGGTTGGFNLGSDTRTDHGDSGGASRFFYVAKADASERPRVGGTAHPTVKPLALMRWLVRLVTPPGGTVLEPFAGSGTTVEACIVERFRCIAIEREADYLPLIEARIARRRNPVRAIELNGEDMGLFGIEDVS